MSKKKNRQNLGCLFLILISLALCVQLIRNNPLVGILVLFLVLLLAVVVALLFRSRRCELCGNVIERKSHLWTIEGAKKTVCPYCNQSLARKRSSAATRRFK